ncbi:MAG TPA: phosphoglycerate dehydrogenase [Chitinophagales bacterium]|nr:phosphoglycerate dehydrogenase [Chitinophagales bacterium]HMW12432.1 phosphoglycerate dehydrogenase [Chitinophagales bacterium]HMX59743.1 phosphoglycerate dehydrogenase [Chitinophagales bacterium]HMY23163.1 phosphoglycerate dehydrogenase [Chitinophagales bacterium]HMZ33399.1 phosphoglycerate dehydrogenase [Chitinophagales bacterium]
MAKEVSFPKEKIKILLLEGLHQSAFNEFNKKGYTSIDSYKEAMTEQELLDCIENYHIIGIRSKTNLTAAVLEKAKKLMTIGCFCIGTNQVDLKKACELGIPVFNSPYSNTRSVAELIIGNAIMLLRGIPQKNKFMHDGNWQKTATRSYELRGKTIGIIGYGHIGTQVSVLAESMGLKVIYFDIEPKLPLGNANVVDTLDELLQKSDIVTLHVPATPQTKNMIGKKEFALMKDGVIFQNLSRGTVVDIEALADAVKSGKISGAAIDVFPTEPKQNGPGFESALVGLYNIILTPHIGGSTQEAQENIGTEVAVKLTGFLDNGSTLGSMSVPEISLSVQQDTRRVLHFHNNVPGVLSEINSTLSKHDVNILGQYLKTNESIGYVVLDVDGNADLEMMEDLKKVKNTIKARILY